MKCRLIAVTGKEAAWVTAACADYLARLPRDYAIELHLIKAPPRTGVDVARLQAREAELIRAKIGTDSRLITLDERGQRLSSREFAAAWQRWREGGRNLAFVIGGADGLTPELLRAADFCLSLSDLTLPHSLARVLLLEQCYRAATINIGHPYHLDG